MSQAKTPTVAIARVLRSFGLKQGGVGRDFTVTGTYRNGERVDTFVILYTQSANETVARNADAIEELAQAQGFWFRVNVRNFNGRATSSIANSGTKVREAVPGITEPVAVETAPSVTSKQPTRYQKTHRPIRVIQVLCTERTRVDGLCAECGRMLDSTGPHRPNWEGALGYIEHYADGSTRILPPTTR